MFDQLDLNSFFNIVESFFKNILISILIIVLCIILYRILVVLLKKVLNVYTDKNKKYIDARKSKTMKSIFISIIKYLLYFIAIFSILAQFGVPVASLVAVAGIGSVAIGFGAQSLVKDVISGLFIILEDQYGVGDYITIDSFSGTVENISVRTTSLRGIDGSLYIIPNGSIGTVINQSKDYSKAIVDIGISYENDIDTVIELLNDEMTLLSAELKTLRQKPVVLGVISLSDSSVVLRIVAECNIGEKASVTREINLRLKRRLNKEQIAIPSPQLSVHIEKGGA